MKLYFLFLEASDKFPPFYTSAATVTFFGTKVQRMRKTFSSRHCRVFLDKIRLLYYFDKKLTIVYLQLLCVYFSYDT